MNSLYDDLDELDSEFERELEDARTNRRQGEKFGGGGAVHKILNLEEQEKELKRELDKKWAILFALVVASVIFWIVWVSNG